MSSIAQSMAHFGSAFWAGALDGGGGGLAHTAFWTAVLQILFVDVLLSGDNAVVIALACRALAPRQRFWGLGIGVSLAVILRIVFTAVAAQLIQLRYLKLVGGLALIYIAAKLLAPEAPDKGEVTPAASLWSAVRIVVVADTVMSLDNILPIAALSRGNLVLLVLGLAGAVPLIFTGAALIAALVDRFPLLVWAGAALLGWIAGDLIATDPAVSGYLMAAQGPAMTRQMEIAAAAAGVVLVLAAGAMLRRRRRSN